ncbi:formylglycine-generating enzyme family protein [Paraburkholderia sp. CNPSo 3274]|uniref:formylglycine-generating enzyme family protein n=1 Tax=Paraburkholderia sp. CNPSo 3274 TaxID=2940932 RepID=UPI0020B75847|nr:formylglycine-generating enzyme family protein [Paraburkholderia sp. CNPSo 3274]MCP3711149.1 formylglycine-generating enzyme family protein [Paraburkholderia sp. CNPSo 3274]
MAHPAPEATHATCDTASPAESPGMVRIAGGTFLMGSNHHYPEEAPAHKVRVRGFWMDRHTVTNDQFKVFVDATGYVTCAERPANPDDYPGALPEMLEPSSVMFAKPSRRVDLRNHYNWWAYTRGADWRHPRGPESSLEGLGDHPVVHVAYEDAAAYARWAGKDLPTEAEWEFAARGGLDGAEFVWGDEFTPQGRQMANTWQGEFPWQNLVEDGYEWTAPVGSYPPNGYGLYDMAGNVWEWTSDWYQDHGKIVKACCTLDNPRGGTVESSVDPRTPQLTIPRKVMKGGSYLCAPNYCRRYRAAARMAQPVDTSTCHVGFRCVVRDNGSG